MLAGCKSLPSATSNTTTTGVNVYTVPQLKYLLGTQYPDLFWNDPDLYPIAREGQELQNALAQFPSIKEDREEFTAILAHLNLTEKSDYTDEEKLLIYREHKMLASGVQISGTASPYSYLLFIGEGQGYKISGTITASGKITELRKEPSFNTHPICLAKGTAIDTPLGPVPVEDLRPGMPVWTENASGERVEGVLIKTAVTEVTTPFYMSIITLQDGRRITASPGHPAADDKALGSYKIGDLLDGSVVSGIETISHNSGFTCDILPAGCTGLYWANGVLLKSTLADK